MTEPDQPAQAGDAAATLPEALAVTMRAVNDQGKRYVEEEDSSSGWYYGYLAGVEQVQSERGGADTVSVQFELVPFEWMESAVVPLGDSTRAAPPLAPFTLLVFDDAPIKEVAAALDSDPDDLAEGEWFLLEVPAARGLNATRAQPVYPVLPVPLKASGRRLDRRRQRILKGRYRPIPRIDIARILRMLTPMRPRRIGVMDVGQASCNLVYDEAGRLMLYVDPGLPLYFNHRSLPIGPAVVNPGPCLGNNPNNPPGIITHFHWDHYSMLILATNSDGLWNRTWLVPHQAAGPALMNVLQQIDAAPNGRVQVFPPGLAGLPAGAFTITQCVPGAGVPPADLNNTGLAVAVRLDDAHDTWSLLPGDAAFQSIPGLAGFGPLGWMVATHHGSDRYLAPPPPPLLAPPVPAPAAANQGRLAYSYGVNGGVPGGNHCYGHPRQPAVDAYIAAGWGIGANVAATAETGPNSDVAGRRNILHGDGAAPAACGVANCPFHAFPKILA